MLRACSAWLQVANGLRIYFDKALPQMLLYPQEQEQCKKVLDCPCCVTS